VTNSADNQKIQAGHAIDLLGQWLKQRIEPDKYDWLITQIDKSLKSNSGKDLFITLGMIPRLLSRQDLNLSADELAQAESARAGWDPSQWSIAGSARIFVTAKLAQSDEAFGKQYQDLCRTADVSESIELYSALPLLPQSPQIDSQVGEGLRTNMRAVFESIAHRNPYPRETFDENRWNHMVLKALFVDSTLAPIQGLDERANDQLAGILCDYAHERWAANRPVTCELWRCVGPFATGKRLEDLHRVLKEDDVDAQRAAAIALSQSPDNEAAKVLASYAELDDAVRSGNIAWRGENPLPSEISALTTA